MPTPSHHKDPHPPALQAPTQPPSSAKHVAWLSSTPGLLQHGSSSLEMTSPLPMIATPKPLQSTLQTQNANRLKLQRDAKLMSNQLEEVLVKAGISKDAFNEKRKEIVAILSLRDSDTAFLAKERKNRIQAAREASTTQLSSSAGADWLSISVDGVDKGTQGAGSGPMVMLDGLGPESLRRRMEEPISTARSASAGPSSRRTLNRTGSTPLLVTRGNNMPRPSHQRSLSSLSSTIGGCDRPTDYGVLGTRPSLESVAERRRPMPLGNEGHKESKLSSLGGSTGGAMDRHLASLTSSTTSSSATLGSLSNQSNTIATEEDESTSGSDCDERYVESLRAAGVGGSKDESQREKEKERAKERRERGKERELMGPATTPRIGTNAPRARTTSARSWKGAAPVPLDVHKTPGHDSAMGTITGYDSLFGSPQVAFQCQGSPSVSASRSKPAGVDMLTDDDVLETAASRLPPLRLPPAPPRKRKASSSTSPPPRMSTCSASDPDAASGHCGENTDDEEVRKNLLALPPRLKKLPRLDTAGANLFIREHSRSVNVSAQANASGSTSPCPSLGLQFPSCASASSSSRCASLSPIPTHRQASLTGSSSNSHQGQRTALGLNMNHLLRTSSPAPSLGNCNPPSSSSGSRPGAVGVAASFRVDAQMSSSGKPTYSYAAMIGQAVLNAPDLKICLNDIYAFIIQHYPYYRKEDAGWQNSIRHNLSLNTSFIKVARRPDEPGKGHFWAIAPGSEDQFINGGFKKKPGGVTRKRIRKQPGDDASSGDFESCSSPTGMQMSYSSPTKPDAGQRQSSHCETKKAASVPLSLFKPLRRSREVTPDLLSEPASQPCAVQDSTPKAGTRHATMMVEDRAIEQVMMNTNLGSPPSKVFARIRGPYSSTMRKPLVFDEEQAKRQALLMSSPAYEDCGIMAGPYRGKLGAPMPETAPLGMSRPSGHESEDDDASTHSSVGGGDTSGDFSRGYGRPFARLPHLPGLVSSMTPIRASSLATFGSPLQTRVRTYSAMSNVRSGNDGDSSDDEKERTGLTLAPLQEENIPKTPDRYTPTSCTPKWERSPGKSVRLTSIAPLRDILSTPAQQQHQHHGASGSSSFGGRFFGTPAGRFANTSPGLLESDFLSGPADPYDTSYQISAELDRMARMKEREVDANGSGAGGGGVSGKGTSSHIFQTPGFAASTPRYPSSPW